VHGVFKAFSESDTAAFGHLVDAECRYGACGRVVVVVCVCVCVCARARQCVARSCEQSRAGPVSVNLTPPLAARTIRTADCLTEAHLLAVLCGRASQKMASPTSRRTRKSKEREKGEPAKSKEREKGEPAKSKEREKGEPAKSKERESGV